MESTRDVLKEKYAYTPDHIIDQMLKVVDYIGIQSGDVLRKYLAPSLKDFHYPFEMKEMEKGVDLLLEHLNGNSRILFYGDYDADGVTTTALFVKVLRDLGYSNIDWFVPSRHKEGYGVDQDRFNEFARQYDLLVTGDTGIKEIEVFHNTPIPVIITDHHEPEVTENEHELDVYGEAGQKIQVGNRYMLIPDVDAVINPKRIDCSYPNDGLSGVAVLFKLFQGVFIKKGLDQKDLIQYLDFGAVGLVADIMPQFNVENQDIEVRLMTALGLQILNRQSSTWVQSLCAMSGKQSISHKDLGFMIGPRLNAPGRLDSPNIAVEFLLEDDPERSMEIAQELEQINNDRKTLQQRAVKDAKENLHLTNEKVIIARVAPEFHSGVAGLVAGNLSNEYHMPAIILCENEIDGDIYLTGSCRSIEGVSILSVLQDTERSFGQYKYGGHAQAAGLTIHSDDYEEFRKHIIHAADKIDSNVLEGQLFYEIEVPIDEIDYTLIDFVDRTFEKIRFYSEGNKLYSPPESMKRTGGAHLYLKKNDKRIKGVIWGSGDQLIVDFSSGYYNGLDIVYTPSIYRNNISVIVDNYREKTI